MSTNTFIVMLALANIGLSIAVLGIFISTMITHQKMQQMQQRIEVLERQR